MLITRYFQEARHVEDILGIKEDGEERDIWFVDFYVTSAAYYREAS